MSCWYPQVELVRPIVLMFYRALRSSSRTQELIFCMLRTMHHNDEGEEERCTMRKKNNTILTKSPEKLQHLHGTKRGERESIRRQRIEDEKRLRKQLEEKRSIRLDDEERLSYLSMIGNPLRSNKPESSIEPDRIYHAEEHGDSEFTRSERDKRMKVYGAPKSREDFVPLKQDGQTTPMISKFHWRNS